MRTEKTPDTNAPGATHNGPQTSIDSTSMNTYTRIDNYTEVCLLRALHYCRYDDVLALCRHQDPAGLHSNSRRLILATLLDAARDALTNGAGTRMVDPATISARLQDVSGPEAHIALTTELPEILAGPVVGAHASTPAVHEIPALWRAVHRARLYRAMDTHAHALAMATTGRDPAQTVQVLSAITKLQTLAQAAGLTPVVLTARRDTQQTEGDA